MSINDKEQRKNSEYITLSYLTSRLMFWHIGKLAYMDSIHLSHHLYMCKSIQAYTYCGLVIYTYLLIWQFRAQTRTYICYERERERESAQLGWFRNSRDRAANIFYFNLLFNLQRNKMDATTLSFLLAFFNTKQNKR